MRRGFQTALSARARPSGPVARRAIVATAPCITNEDGPIHQLAEGQDTPLDVPHRGHQPVHRAPGEPTLVGRGAALPALYLDADDACFAVPFLLVPSCRVVPAGDA